MIQTSFGVVFLRAFNMNPSLVFICCVLAFAVYTEAYPGMRGNGASGATKDRDPENPFFKIRHHDAIADAKAAGNNPRTTTFTQQKGGSKFAIAQASNTGGGSISASASA